eukprot:Nitzschia sp. Nitz4//scaffold123_size70294//2070//2804//NITZ4_005916-RA/size70294-processed-gene-0.12-mRNA-1//-1//CDS//3329534449//5816//frame0
MMTTQPPQDFLCPLTKKIMKDPVETTEGINFEREAIAKWLSFRSSCPITGTPLREASLRTNTKLQWMIKYWMSKQAENEETSDSEPSAPERFVCPLTQSLMVEPVTIREGANFEKDALIRFIEKNGEISPMSGQPLGEPAFYPNQKLQWQIKHYKEDMIKLKEEQEAAPVPPAVVIETVRPQPAATTKKTTQQSANVSLTNALKTGNDIRTSRSSGSFSLDSPLFDGEKQDLLTILNEACTYAH